MGAEFVADALMPNITKRKSVQLLAILENVIEFVSLLNVVVAIGSYVAGIFTP